MSKTSKNTKKGTKAKTTVKVETKSNNYRSLLIAAGAAVIAIIVAVVVAVLTNTPVSVILTVPEDEESVPVPTITIGEDDETNVDSEYYGRGEAGEEVENEEIKTYEEVDSQVKFNDDGVEESASVESETDILGLGKYIWAPTESWSVFKNYAQGKCWDVDGYYGEQCVDYAAVAWMNMTDDGRAINTCGTGAAKGIIQDGCWQKNAGTEFVTIWNSDNIKPGDFVVFTNGLYGHIGMAVGYPNNGYITLQGENQGGSLCPGSSMGGSVNIINISLKSFGGAFRLKKWIEPEPTPTPTPEPTPTPSETVSVTVKAGDTLGQILLDAGYTGDNLFGDSGICQKVAEYNDIENRGLIYPGQTINIPSDLLSE